MIYFVFLDFLANSPCNSPPPCCQGVGVEVPPCSVGGAYQGAKPRVAWRAPCHPENNTVLAPHTLDTMKVYQCKCPVVTQPNPTVTLLQVHGHTSCLTITSEPMATHNSSY